MNLQKADVMSNLQPLPASWRRLTGDLLLGSVLGVAGSIWLSWLALRTGAQQGQLAGVTLSMLWFTLPLAMVGVTLALQAIRRSERGEPRFPVALLATVPVAAVSVSIGHQLQLTAPRLNLTSLVGGTMALEAAGVLVVLLPLGSLLLRLRDLGRVSSSRRRRTRLVLVLGLAVATALSTSTLTAPTATGAGSAVLPCLKGGPVSKTFDVTALDVDIPINRYGDHDPGGKMYTLTSQIAAVRAQAASQKVSIGLRDDPIQPLVIRANEGDCVQISFTNTATGGIFGMHIDGLEFTKASSGDKVGSNLASGVALGQTATYRFAIPNDPRLEGAHYVHPGPGYRAAVDHGLFGTLMVEPPGSTYWNASTPDKPLASGWEAIIKPGGLNVPCDRYSHVATCAFRESALLHHEIGNDNEQLTNKSGELISVVDGLTGSYRPGSFALNYRSEPFRNRLLAFPREKAHAYSSYTFGEPATPIVRGYLADPTKLRIIHVGAEKFHIFHLHGGGDRWRFNPVADSTFNYADTGLNKTPDTVSSPSQRLDSQSIGPGEAYNLEIEGGAGGVQQSAGDFLFHCHIAKHYTSGMWAFWRVYDTQQPDLVPLGDRMPPPQAVDSRGLIGKTVNNQS
ncbi:MAG: hypothetical protein QOH68_1847, partial [Nocardioidaceae bacterium]|nr:hypothetical protein [Nocardioidaceae bacterium]